jgi:hypothetical protein
MMMGSPTYFIHVTCDILSRNTENGITDQRRKTSDIRNWG